jgi:hypothetical protein
MSPCLFQHTLEHAFGQKSGILSEHAEDQPIDEVGDGFRTVATRAQSLRESGKVCGSFLGQLRSGLPRFQLFRIRPYPFQRLPNFRIPQVVKRELVGCAYAVCPIRVYLETIKITDDQKRRVL